MRVLFLDFDGCLHVKGQLPFEYLPILERELEPFPDVRLVVSSSWREIYSLDEIIDMFPSTLRSRLIGMTPVLGKQPEGRGLECRTWLAQNAPTAGWIAIDDDSTLFAPGDPHVVPCESRQGIADVRVIDALRRWLEQA